MQHIYLLIAALHGILSKDALVYENLKPFLHIAFRNKASDMKEDINSIPTFQYGLEKQSTIDSQSSRLPRQGTVDSLSSRIPRQSTIDSQASRLPRQSKVDSQASRLQKQSTIDSMASRNLE